MYFEITDIIQIFNAHFIVASEPYTHPTTKYMVVDAVKMDTGEKHTISVHVILKEGSVLSKS